MWEKKSMVQVSAFGCISCSRPSAVSDRELMMVNLDLLDTFDARQFPPRQLNFVLYNPTAEARFATITIPSAPGAKVHWSRDGKAIAETLIVPGRAILRMVADF